MARGVRAAVLLRGVNVGGHRRVPMAELRALLEELGGTAVKTYLQSGNAVLDWPGSPDALEEAVRAGLVARLGLDVPVLVRTADELVQVVEQDPFADTPPDPKLRHVGFLSAEPDPAAVAAIDPARYAPDRIAVVGRHAYLDITGAVHTSPLTTRGPKLGVDMTARNWRTVLALRDLAAG